MAIYKYIKNYLDKINFKKKHLIVDNHYRKKVFTWQKTLSFKKPFTWEKIFYVSKKDIF